MKINNKNVFVSILFAGLVLLPQVVKANEEWLGLPDWRYDSVCLDGDTNARTSPRFQNNVRAVFVDGSCGNIMYRNGRSVYENGFYLIEFYVDELQAERRYWIHESQIEVFYPGD